MLAWRLSNTLEVDFCVAALEEALSKGRPQIFNTDQGKGRGGRVFDYLEGHAVIDQANLIFGYGGWGYELVGDVTLRQIETVDPQTGEIKTTCAYSAPVRVTVAGALPRTDTGVHPVAEDTLDGHDTAIKGAVTDGMKRAFRSFGIQFGNGILWRPGPGQRPAPTGPGARPAQGGVRPRRTWRRCANGSSSWPPSRASARTRCGPPWWTGWARAWTT